MLRVLNVHIAVQLRNHSVPLCVSGCLCPEGLLLNDSGKCVTEEQCPCVHNGITYQPGDTVTFHCDQCVCRNRTWVCDNRSDMGFCTVYGEGHCNTFDNKRYTISGDCEHILVEDYCDIDDLSQGTFRVIAENIPCGTTGTSCSKAIVAYLGAHKLILTDGILEVIKRASEVDIPYKVRNMGNFLVIEAMNGLVIIWDRMTSIFIHLSKIFKGKVCGLCGNFDGNSNNDFTTRSQYVVGDAREFTDSWKLAPECPDIFITKGPCLLNPYRVPWAQKHCSLITSDVFASCHAEVDPEKYFEACVSDTCACDMGGDCDCFCTAIAAYAQACSDACVCIDWRTPTICPLFCDFYNKEGQCQWHYMPCGAPCMKTCRNPSGKCLFHLKGLEGCYPECPKNKPFFNEHEMICVSQCGCFDDDDDNYYQVGAKIKSCNSCEDCVCSAQGIICKYDINACFCEYKGHFMDVGEIIQTEDKFQNCIIVTCGLNGTVVSPCYPTTNSTIETRTATTSLFSKSTYETKFSLGTTIPSTRSFRSSSISSSTTFATSRLSRTSTSSSSTKSTSTKVSSAQTFTTSETISSRVPPAPSSSTVTTRSSEVSPLSTVTPGPTKFTTHPKTSTEITSKAIFSTVPKTSSFFRPNTTTGPLKTSTQSVVSSTLSLGVPETPTKVSVKSTETTAKTKTLGSSSTQVKEDEERTTKARINTKYKCINVTCLDNGELDVDVLPCSEVKNITCDNGKMPIKIYDQDGCCYHYECPGCMGTGGIRRHPGEMWVEHCQTCTCDNDLLKIFCSPVKCTNLDPHVCDKPWLQPLIVVTESDICCPRVECGCIPANCNNLAPNCPLGHIAFPIIDSDGCCITFDCRAMDVCVHEGAVYEAGKFIWTEKSSCNICQCTNMKDTQSGLNVVSCERVTCNETCSEEFAYEKSEIDCCGSCVQVSCVVEISDGSLYFLQPGESQFYGDLCTLYTCTVMNGRFVTLSQNKLCPELHEEECESGIIIKTPDGCCDVCKGFELCGVHEKQSLISYVGCEANVTQTYCEGLCSSFREFSTKELAMDGVCSCCHELETTQEAIELACPSGKYIPYILTYVQKCGCVSKVCTP